MLAITLQQLPKLALSEGDTGIGAAVTIPLTEIRGFYRMRERTDIPTSYSVGTGIGRSRHPWKARLRLRDSTTILWRCKGFTQPTLTGWNPIPYLLKNVRNRLPRGCLWTNASYQSVGRIAVMCVTVLGFNLRALLPQLKLGGFRAWGRPQRRYL
jgi:hypothetical protein